MPSPRLGIVYDFRNPESSGIPNPEFHAAIIDQVAWLYGLGLEQVWFTEHHFVEDGYLDLIQSENALLEIVDDTTRCTYQ